MEKCLLYIEHILKNFTEEEFEKFASNILLYSRCISDKIDELSDAYAEKKFYNQIEADAGKQFKYYLVYDKLQVEGSKTKEQFLELMKDL